MGQINTYLTFNGNCREAMEFYKDMATDCVPPPGLVKGNLETLPISLAITGC